MADLPLQVSQYSKGISQLSNAGYKPFPQILLKCITPITNKEVTYTCHMEGDKNVFSQPRASMAKQKWFFFFGLDSEFT
jgi:hypothetical protein